MNTSLNKLRLKRTNSEDTDFRELVKKLDEDLKIKDGDDHDFYNQFNQLDSIKYSLVGYLNDIPVACGAIKKFDDTTMEVKRMFVDSAYRSRGLASQILTELETWAKELNMKYCILETGLKQQDAIQLYFKNNYKIFPNYGQYTGVENSRCFKKELETS